MTKENLDPRVAAHLSKPRARMVSVHEDKNSDGKRLTHSAHFVQGGKCTHPRADAMEEAGVRLRVLYPQHQTSTSQKKVQFGSSTLRHEITLMTLGYNPYGRAVLNIGFSSGEEPVVLNAIECDYLSGSMRQQEAFWKKFKEPFSDTVDVNISQSNLTAVTYLSEDYFGVAEVRTKFVRNDFGSELVLPKLPDGVKAEDCRFTPLAVNGEWVSDGAHFVASEKSFDVFKEPIDPAENIVIGDSHGSIYRWMLDGELMTMSQDGIKLLQTPGDDVAYHAICGKVVLNVMGGPNARERAVLMLHHAQDYANRMGYMDVSECSKIVTPTGDLLELTEGELALLSFKLDEHEKLFAHYDGLEVSPGYDYTIVDYTRRGKPESRLLANRIGKDVYSQIANWSLDRVIPLSRGGEWVSDIAPLAHGLYTEAGDDANARLLAQRTVTRLVEKGVLDDVHSLNTAVEDLSEDASLTK